MFNMFSPIQSLRIIEVEPIPIYEPARKHRKRRIQKKWLKRYGKKLVRYHREFGDNIIVDERNNVIYCHPDIARRVRQMAREIEKEINSA